MNIRLAVVEDAHVIACIASSLGYQEQESDSLAIERLEKILLSNHDKVWVAEYEEEVIGWLHAQHAFRVASSDFIEILGLSVSEAFRFQGAGRALVELAKTWSSSENISLWVRTNEIRKDAKQFYSSLGFSLIKSQSVFEITD